MKPRDFTDFRKIISFLGQSSSASGGLWFILLSFFLSGCGEKSPRTQGYVLGTTDKVVTLDPADAYDYLSGNIIENVFDRLVRYQVGTTEIEPSLATQWEISPDGITYTFTLREGVKFHDGTDLTPEAVKFSLDRARTLGGDPGFLLDVIEEVSIEDKGAKAGPIRAGLPVAPGKVIIQLKYPFTAFLSILAFSASSPVSPSDYTMTEKHPVNPVGTGPYRVVAYREGDLVELEAFPDYWGEKPKTSRVMIKLYDTSSALKLALQNQEVDVAYRTFTPTELEDLRKKPDLQVLEGESPAIRYLVINVTHSPFTDLNLRKAIACAVDREAINRIVYLGTVEPLYSMIPIGMLGHLPVYQKPYGNGNIELAQEYLNAAGYSESKKAEIDLWFTPTHYGDVEDEVAQVVQKSLEATGMIKVQLQSSEWAEFTDAMVRSAYGIFLLGWYPDYVDPDDYTYPFLSTEGAKSLGSFYSNPEMDILLRKERVEVDLEARVGIFHEIQNLLAQEVPYVPLFQSKQYAVFQKNIQGVLLEPTQVFRYSLISFTPL
ncbi:peptide ABC transporter substrate-binding protein [candidate division TA06 bacterium]|nr:peptide ABC transporter substrate-binding protein [candidate division TA06 bacterium]